MYVVIWLNPAFFIVTGLTYTVHLAVLFYQPGKEIAQFFLPGWQKKNSLNQLQLERGQW